VEGWRTKRRLVSLLASSMVLVGLVAQPVTLSGFSTAGADQPPSNGWHYPGDPISNPGCNDPAGGCRIDANTGCPEQGPIREVQAGEHCVPLPAELVTVPDCASGGGYVINFYAQVDLLPSIDDYEAVWWSDIGLGTRWWSSPGTVGPNYVTGEGERYQVPDGSAAWSAAGGAGGSGCVTAAPGGTSGVSGWGATAKWEVSGQVTYAESGDPAPGVTVNADCASGGSKTTDSNGYYLFLLDKGPCTIAPVPPPGQEVAPEKRVLDVQSNIYHVDFQLSATLYYKVQSDLPSVTAGGALLKAGNSFSETVTLKDLSKTKTLVVAPIYPKITGNAEGGALVGSGSLPNGQMPPLSYIVLLRPGQKQVFTSTITTTASRALGTDDGGQTVSGGTRAEVQYPVPRAFVMRSDEDFVPLDPDQVDIAKGSTDAQTVSIDDSAPDHTFPSGYNAVEDVSNGVWVGIKHLTVGTLNSIWQTLVSLGKFAHEEAPTAVIAYVQLESELWNEAKQDSSEMDALQQFVKSSVKVI
jgi:hypothetical protein